MTRDGPIHDPADLRAFAEQVLRKAGLPRAPASAVAEGLVEADLYGHDTHGLALLADYVEEIREGRMERKGRPRLESKMGAVETWDARRLPGVWTTRLAVDAAVAKAGAFGIGAVAIRRSHHIACLATFLERPARRGFLVLLFSSDPSDAHVAPYGGTRAVLTPDPIAAGIPAAPDPILIDISTSIIAAGHSARALAEGRRLAHPWLMTEGGSASDDPRVLKDGGSILPIGGLDHGHKGYALSLLVECLTQGLSGHGRAEQPKEWGASILVIAIAPKAFAGEEQFAREANWTIAACRASPPVPGGSPVRIPGELAMARKREALRTGLVLHPEVETSLAKLSASLVIELPRARGVNQPAPLPPPSNRPS